MAKLRHFALVVSIDAQGEVTPVYAAGDRSLGLTSGSPQFLPESLAFTGQGLGGAGVHWTAQLWRFYREDFTLRSTTVERYGESKLPAGNRIQAARPNSGHPVT